MSEGSIRVDYLIIICGACARQYTLYPDEPLVGGEALLDWFRAHVRPCVCGATTCDIKAHLTNPEVLNS